VNRYNLALLLLALAAVPLFYVSAWLGVAALTAIYALLARLANKDFERPSGPQLHGASAAGRRRSQHKQIGRYVGALGATPLKD